MSYLVRKTVAIGLGGTGRDAILNLKKKLLAVYGEIPPTVKCLVFDTTEPEALTTEEGEQVDLDPSEFLKLEVKNPITVVQHNNEVKAWFPSWDNVPRQAITKGAKQIRPLGRLSLYANANDVYNGLKNIVSNIRNYAVGRLSGGKYEVSSNEVILNIIGSIAGGTGSGTFLDVAFILREFLEIDDFIVGYFLLPDIFVGRAGTANTQPNAYGAIRELDYFMDNIGTIEYKFNFAGNGINVEQVPFNYVYLINNQNRIGTEYDKIEDLTEFLGTALFLSTGVAGKASSDVWDNLDQQIMSQGKWWGKTPRYNSLGVSEIVYKGSRIAEVYKKIISIKLLQQTFQSGDFTQVHDDVETFIDQIQIREDEADYVIDSILSVNDIRKFSLPSEITKETLKSALQRRVSYLSELEQQLKEKSNNNMNNLKEEKINLLDSHLKNKINQVGGLQYCLRFIGSLLGRIEQFKEMMQQERQEQEDKEKILAQKLKVFEEDAKKAISKRLAYKKAVETAAKNFQTNVNAEALVHCEKIRRENAILFFSGFTEKLKDWQMNLNNLGQNFEFLEQELNKTLQQAKTVRQKIKPFIIEIEPVMHTSQEIEVSSNDFLQWLNKEKKLNIYDLFDKSLKDIQIIFNEYAEENSVVKEVLQKKLEDVLKEYDEEKRIDLIKQLDEMAIPLWQFDAGRVTGDKKTELIYLFGVENPENSIFTGDTLKKSIKMNYEPAIVSTGDPNRIVCLKTEAAVPAFVVSNFDEYNEKFISRDSFTFHTGKDWDRTLPDLFPITEEEKNRVHWSLALADPFGLINRKGQYYYIRSKLRGQRTQDYVCKLAQGRIEAMNAFLKDSDLLEEIKGEIEKILIREGNERIANGLREYMDNLKNQVSRHTTKTSEDLRLQIENELGDIENYISQLSSIG